MSRPLRCFIFFPSWKNHYGRRLILSKIVKKSTNNKNSLIDKTLMHPINIIPGLESKALQTAAFQWSLELQIQTINTLSVI